MFDQMRQELNENSMSTLGNMTIQFAAEHCGISRNILSKDLTTKALKLNYKTHTV